MTPWKIYHNPQCSKSRQTLALLQENGIQPTVIEYLKTPPSTSELKSLIEALGEDRSSIVRIKESAFKEKPFDTSDTEAVVQNISETPKLLERPIVVHGKKAVIGRPPENIHRLLQK